ncbi:DUF2971 domain-containing protein [Leptospira montravelensis]|uniref:DUF2971 domain-containing protein n=1 Tax=Leptospira montravelensis TaxID=2484961 RepID=A0ABY2LMG5_9LEPT|nr:DUF2971 domain-containing protein [Leptospira montravelensis]TGK82694.1 DUF2971 domain-containing protein [Leptospira montravelensis]TGK94999.1 DUF2971 domain-containing protein [Leptospira montravelensis]
MKRKTNNTQEQRKKKVKAFKFKSSLQFDHILDIIINKRLYCSDWLKLNDPMEGQFAYSYNNEVKKVSEIINGIVDKKKQYKVCSLSSIYNSHLLWAHYANGFDGVAIEVELNENKYIQRVNYGGVFAGINLNNNMETDEIARTILFSKYIEWNYEKEIRILCHQEYYYDLKIKRVIAGTRINKILCDTLNFICHNLGIPFSKIGIGDEGMDIDFVNPIKNFKTILEAEDNF